MVRASGACRKATLIRRSIDHRRPLLAQQAVVPCPPPPRRRNASFLPFARFVLPRAGRLGTHVGVGPPGWSIVVF
jgi:hypothetical protein